MLRKLSTTSKAAKEIKQFETEISKIENSTARNKGFELLKKLKAQNNIIDFAHSPLSAVDIDNEKIRENIQSSVEIREKIKKLIKDANS